MKVALSLDDFSVLNNRLDLLWILREHFTDFRISLFTVPKDIKHKDGNRDEALIRIKECLDWIEIIPHGLHHNSSEAKKWDYFKFKDKIMPSIKKAFDKDGLPFEKGFKAPHWDWNKGVVRALDEAGWWGAISPRRPEMAVTKRFYTYTHSINEPFPLDQDLRLTGHINGTSPDDLEKCFNNLLRLPVNTEWHFVTEYIENL